LIALGVLAIVSSACKSAHPAQPAPLVAVAAKRSVPGGNAPPSALASASPSPSPTPLAPPVCPFGTDDASLAAALAAQHTDLRSLPQGIAPFSYPLEYGGGDLESAVYFAASVGVVEVTGVTIGQPDGLDAGLPVDVEFRLVQALKGDPATQSPLHAVYYVALSEHAGQPGQPCTPIVARPPHSLLLFPGDRAALFFDGPRLEGFSGGFVLQSGRLAPDPLSSLRADVVGLSEQQVVAAIQHLIANPPQPTFVAGVRHPAGMPEPSGAAAHLLRADDAGACETYGPFASEAEARAFADEQFPVRGGSGWDVRIAEQPALPAGAPAYYRLGDLDPLFAPLCQGQPQRRS